MSDDDIWSDENDAKHEKDVYDNPDTHWCTRHFLSSDLLKQIRKSMQKWKKTLTKNELKALQWYKAESVNFEGKEDPLYNAYSQLNYWVRG
jgi:hypothetical protein